MKDNSDGSGCAPDPAGQTPAAPKRDPWCGKDVKEICACLRSKLLVLFPGSNRADERDEIGQDAMFAVHRFLSNGGSFQTQSLASFLRKVALCAHAARFRRNRCPLFLPPEDLPDVAAPSDSGTSGAAEARAIIQAAMANMSPEVREVCQAMLEHDANQTEAARHLSIARTTVISRWNQAKEVIRRMAGEENLEA